MSKFEKNAQNHPTREGLSNELCIVVNWYVSRVFFRHLGKHSFFFLFGEGGAIF